MSWLDVKRIPQTNKPVHYTLHLDYPRLVSYRFKCFFLHFETTIVKIFLYLLQLNYFDMLLLYRSLCGFSDTAELYPALLLVISSMDLGL